MLNRCELDAAVEMYVKCQKSTRKIATELAMPISRVRRMLLSAGITLRSVKESNVLQADERSARMKGQKFGKRSNDARARIRAGIVHYWQGRARGSRINSNGYVEYTIGPNKGRSVHVVTMETAIGRHLYKHEVVHHIDENRTNNGIENLALMTRAEHARYHRRFVGTPARRVNGQFMGKGEQDVK